MIPLPHLYLTSIIVGYVGCGNTSKMIRKKDVLTNFHPAENLIVEIVLHGCNSNEQQHENNYQDFFNSGLDFIRLYSGLDFIRWLLSVVANALASTSNSNKMP